MIRLSVTAGVRSDALNFSTAEQRQDSQREELHSYCDRRGWMGPTRTFYEDVASGARASRANASAGTSRAPLVEAALLQNLKIADGLGLLTPVNREALRRGAVPTVTRGPYAGQRVEVDHVVPLFHAPELDHELANLELLPAGLNRAKGVRVGERQMDYARRFRDAGVLRAGTFERLQGVFRPACTIDVELILP